MKSKRSASKETRTTVTHEISATELMRAFLPAWPEGAQVEVFVRVPCRGYEAGEELEIDGDMPLIIRVVSLSVERSEDAGE